MLVLLWSGVGAVNTLVCSRCISFIEALISSTLSSMSWVWLKNSAMILATSSWMITSFSLFPLNTHTHTQVRHYISNQQHVTNIDQSKSFTALSSTSLSLAIVSSFFVYVIVTELRFWAIQRKRIYTVMQYNDVKQKCISYLIFLHSGLISIFLAKYCS